MEMSTDCQRWLMPSPGPEHLPFRPQMPSSPHGPRLLIILGLCLSVSQFLHLLLSGFSFKRLFKVAFEKDWLILMSMMHLLKEKQVASGANGKCQFQACICQLDCYQLVLLINISTNALFSSFCYWYREFGLSNFQSWNSKTACSSYAVLHWSVHFGEEISSRLCQPTAAFLSWNIFLWAGD